LIACCERRVQGFQLLTLALDQNGGALLLVLGL
jgi:hypothetical protein